MRLINTTAPTIKSYKTQEAAIAAIEKLESKLDLRLTVIMSINAAGRFVPVILPTEVQMVMVSMVVVNNGFMIART